MKYLMSLLLSAPLLGCVGTVQTYPGSPQAINKVAVVKGINIEFAGNTYRTYFASYSSIEPTGKQDFQNVGDYFVGYPRELHMAAGNYLILTRCSIGDQYAFPSVQLHVIEGMTYEIACEPVADELSKVKTSVRNAAKTRPPN